MKSLITSSVVLILIALVTASGCKKSSTAVPTNKMGRVRNWEVYDSILTHPSSGIQQDTTLSYNSTFSLTIIDDNTVSLQPTGYQYSYDHTDNTGGFFYFKPSVNNYNGYVLYFYNNDSVSYYFTDLSITETIQYWAHTY